MPTDLDIEQPMSTLGSVFRAVDRPGQIVRNTLRGRPGAVGRHFLSLLGDVVDFAIPGDWIPEFTRKEDFVTGAELVGLQDATPWARIPIGLLVDLATDPLTYIGIGPIAKGATKGAQTAYQAARSATKAGLLGRAASKAGKKLVSMGDDLVVEGMEQGGKAGARAIDAGTRMVTAGQKAGQEALKHGLEARKLLAAADQAPFMHVGIPFTKIGKDLPLTVGQAKAPFRKAYRGLIGAIPEGATKEQLRQVKRWGKDVANWTRGGLGWLNPGHFVSGLRVEAEAGKEATSLGLKWLQNNWKWKAGGKVDEAISAVMDGVNWKAGGKQFLVDAEAQGAKIDWGARIAAAAKIYGVPEKEIRQGVDLSQKMLQDWWQTWVKEGVVTGPGHKSYMPRIVKGHVVDPTSGDIVKELTSLANPTGKRQLPGAKNIVNYLSQPKNANIRFETSALRRMQGRAVMQGVGVSRARMARKILGDSAVLNDPGVRQAIEATLDHIKANDFDLYNTLAGIFKTAPPRGWFADVLAVNNRVFKPAATFGIFLPRFSFLTRNKLSSVWQTFSVDGAKPAQAVKTIVSDLHGAIGDGLMKIGIGKKRVGALKPYFTKLDEAFNASGGDLSRYRAALQDSPQLLEAFDNGVLQGFVTTEGMARSFARMSSKKLADWMSWPAEIQAGLESRMRLGAFLDLRTKHSAKNAARIIREAFLDYSPLQGTNTYMTARQLIPFLAFTAQTIPQQAKFLTREPWVAVALASLYGEQGLVPPWISEQPSIRLGANEEGTPLYATTLGLPIDALNFIPNFSGDMREIGADIRRSVLGSANPLLKASYGYISGRDPYFNSPYGSYSRNPRLLQALGAGKESESARVYREIASAGLVQPVEAVLTQTDRALDQRMPAWARALNLATGVRIYPADPDQALVQILQTKLAVDPRAKTWIRYSGGSDETDEMIEALQGARKRLRDKREATRAKAAGLAPTATGSTPKRDAPTKASFHDQLKKLGVPAKTAKRVQWVEPEDIARVSPETGARVVYDPLTDAILVAPGVSPDEVAASLRKARIRPSLATGTIPVQERETGETYTQNLSDMVETSRRTLRKLRALRGAV